MRSVNRPLACRREEREARGRISDYIYSSGGKVLYSRAHKIGFGAKCIQTESDIEVTQSKMNKDRPNSMGRKAH